MFEKPQLHDLLTLMDMKVDLKNESNFMAIIGRYILTPDIFEILEDLKPNSDNEIQITDALLSQAKKGKVIAFKFKGKRFDCGSIKGYLEASNYFSKKIGIDST